MILVIAQYELQERRHIMEFSDVDLLMIKECLSVSKNYYEKEKKNVEMLSLIYQDADDDAYKDLMNNFDKIIKEIELLYIDIDNYI